MPNTDIDSVILSKEEAHLVLNLLAETSRRIPLYPRERALRVKIQQALESP